MEKQISRTLIENKSMKINKRFERISEEKKIIKIDGSMSIKENFGGYLDSSDSKLSHESTINKNRFGWVDIDNSFFISQKPNTESIPAGLYNVKTDMQRGVYIEKKSVLLDEIFLVPDRLIAEITDDLAKFWESKQRYKDYKITYKRGILTYGPPGTGKTSVINLTIAEICEKYDGIAINMEDTNSFLKMAELLRSMEPNRPILAIIEDLDSFLNYNSTKEFLNILDGNNQIDNIVYLATTNYIERIEDRIKNRPSRFDRKYEISYPSDEVRKFYIEKKLKPNDLKEIDINKWIADTKGMSFAHLKELVCSVIVMGVDYQKTINELKTMRELTN